jgi:hypothetical protein
MTLAVLRGPWCLGLHTLARWTLPALDGIVLVAEAKRTLTRRDVADVCGVALVATVLATNALARTIDAGLLLSRLDHLTEFRPLRRCATNLLVARDDRPRTSTTPVAPPQHARPETAFKTVTDLPVALSATGRALAVSSIADASDDAAQSRAVEARRRFDGVSMLRPDGRDVHGALATTVRGPRCRMGRFTDRRAPISSRWRKRAGGGTPSRMDGSPEAERLRADCTDLNARLSERGRTLMAHR